MTSASLFWNTKMAAVTSRENTLRPRPHGSVFLFFFPETATVHTHSTNSTANLNIFKSPTNPITCGRVNPDIFESDDVANSCPVSCRTINQYGSTTATTGQIYRQYRALYGACSEDILLQRSLGYYRESGHHRMRVDRALDYYLNKIPLS